MSIVGIYLSSSLHLLTLTAPILQGQVADIHITEHGSDWLWAAFSIFALSFLIVLGLSHRKPVTQRAFYYILSAVLFIASLDYYAQASNLGFVPIPVEFQRTRHTVSGTSRQIWYSRYIDYFITDALLWLAILLVARAPWQQILFIILLTWVTIVGGLLGALTPSRYKWGWFTFAVFSYLVVAFNVLVPARRHAALGGSDIGRTFTSAAALFLFLSLLYPIAWGLSEGGNYIAPDSEVVFYGVLDILSKLGVTGLLLFGLRNLDAEHLGIVHRGWDHDEKHRAAAPATATV